MSLYIKRNKKRSEIAIFKPIGAVIFTHELASYVGETVTFLFFEAGNIAISEAQIAFGCVTENWVTEI